MTHADVESLLGAVALHAASTREEREVRAHAEACASCAIELARYDTVVALLSS